MLIKHELELEVVLLCHVDAPVLCERGGRLGINSVCLEQVTIKRRTVQLVPILELVFLAEVLEVTHKRKTI